MQFIYAIVTIKDITLAAILADIESTYPGPGAALIERAQRVFPTLPILILSPRIEGFSRSYATFDLDHLITHINADAIDWSVHECPPSLGESPF